MSYFPDKSQEQIAELDDEAVTRVINLECAKQGIPIFMEQPTKPTLQIAEDVTLHRLGDWMFFSAEDAARVAGVIESCKRASRNYEFYDSTRKTYRLDESEVDSKPEKYYSPEKYEQYRSELAQHAKATADYEEALKTFKNVTAEKAKVVDAVLEEVNTARAAIRERQRVISLYEKYVELANGDRDIAWNFLRMAERLTPEQVQEMKLHEAIQVGAFDAPDWRPAEAAPEDYAAV